MLIKNYDEIVLEDYRVAGKDLSCIVENEKIYLEMNTDATDDLIPKDVFTRPLLVEEERQLLRHTPIPLNYWRKLPMDLKEKNLYHWFEKSIKPKSEWLLRRSPATDNIVGMLSRRYYPLDNFQVARKLESEILKGMPIKECTFSGSHKFSTFKVVTDMKFDFKSPMYAGVVIQNSEVGHSSFQINFMIWEEVCTNGLIIAHGRLPMFRKLHMIREREYLDYALKLLPEFIAKGHKTFQKYVSNIEKVKMTEQAFDSISVKHYTFKKFLDGYREEFEGRTLRDFIFKLTEDAQDFSEEYRNKLERLAGELVVGMVA